MRMRSQLLQAAATGIFQLVVQKKRREFAYACTFGGNFELKITRMRESCWTTNWKIPVTTDSKDGGQASLAT